MGKKDNVTKEYMKDNLRFADAFNYYMFGGENVIRAEELEEQDTSELLNLYGDDKELVSKQVFRDVLKRSVLKRDGKSYYFLLGIENQSEVHYAMPVRNYVYDALNYQAQVSETAKRHKQAKDIGGKEYLSGFKRTDKLIPVITLVILWDSGSWDGPRSLHEMMAVQDRKILQYVPNYHLNLIVPEEIENFEHFHSELSEVLKFIAVKDDRGKLQELILENHENYSKLDQESAAVLETCANVKVTKKDTEGRVNMCKGLEDWVAEEVEKERKEIEERAVRETEERMCKGLEDWVAEEVEKERKEIEERAVRETEERMNREIEEWKAKEKERITKEAKEQVVREMEERLNGEIEEWKAEEKEKAVRETIAKMSAKGISLEDICDIVNEAPERVLGWLADAGVK